MSYRRRLGNGWKRRQKVKREEMVKFYQRARLKERLGEAERRAKMVATWIRRGLWALAIAGAAVVVWIRLG